jgi:acyl-CoA reductase-like NAD-dependent aldehyde dehydrogenase
LPANPLSSVRTLRHLVRALPPGVLNFVTGADEVVGPVVVGDPRIKHGLRATLGPTWVGPGLDPDTTMGPLNTERQRDYVAGLCEEALGADAEVLTFGEYTSGVEGNYLLPALVLGPALHLKIVTEEQFGPALPVITCDSEDEAITLANQTWSGLCSSVWSADTEHAMTVARQLRTGGGELGFYPV